MTHYRYTLLRYVPDIVKGEFVNLGVMLLNEQGGFLEGRMAGEEEVRRLRWLHPEADVEMIKELQAGFAQQLPWDKLDKLRDEFSTSLVLTAPKILETSQAWKDELDALFHRHVAAPPRPSRETDKPRQQLRQRMEMRFRVAGLLGRLKPFPAAPFTVPGDTIKIDYAYAPAGNGKRKYIHAITLDRAPHQAKVLAFTFEHIRRSQAGDQMTAVYETAPSARNTPMGTPIGALLESSGIRVQPYEQLDALVREIRQDLAMA